MERKKLSRRRFLATSTAATTLAILPRAKAAPLIRTTNAATPALLGGTPVRTKPFPRWPVWTDADEQAIAWVRAGAPSDKHRRLGYVPPEG